MFFLFIIVDSALLVSLVLSALIKFFSLKSFSLSTAAANNLSFDTKRFFNFLISSMFSLKSLWNCSFSMSCCNLESSTNFSSSFFSNDSCCKCTNELLYLLSRVSIFCSYFLRQFACSPICFLNVFSFKETLCSCSVTPFYTSTR